MAAISRAELIAYVEQHVPDFHRRRLQRLEALKLKALLLKKNPYLFRAKDVSTAAELVRNVLDAYLSSQEETVFGSFLEGLATYVCARAYGGRESAAEGIDLEFEKEGILYIVSIKSGPNWGNASQINRMKDCFRKAKRVLGSHQPARRIEAVNGCCYGRSRCEQKTEYTKLCGQRFWTFVSGEESLYKEIIEPLGYQARERNEEFAVEYAKVLNRFTADFISEFCRQDGAIDWEKLVEFNSRAPRPKTQPGVTSDR